MHSLSSSMRAKNMYFNRTTGQNLKICINSLSNWIWSLFFAWRYSKSFLLATVSEMFTEFGKTGVCIANREITIKQK